MSTPFNNFYEPEATAVKSDRPDVILQNITPGHHCVVDKQNGIDLYFEPFGAIDLTYFDTGKMRRSPYIQKSLIEGYLVPITREEYDHILYAESQKLKQEALDNINPGKKTRTKSFEVDGREIEAEVVNLSKVDSSSAQAHISSAGQSNDPTSFAIAYNRARKEYAIQGINLTAQNFHQMVEADANRAGGGTLIKQYLRKEKSDSPITNGVLSGQEGKGTFYVAGQNGQVNQFGQPINPPVRNGLKNYNAAQDSASRDLFATANKINDSYDPDADTADESPMAQIIDLADDSEDIGGGGNIRRL